MGDGGGLDDYVDDDDHEFEDYRWGHLAAGVTAVGLGCFFTGGIGCVGLFGL